MSEAILPPLRCQVYDRQDFIGGVGASCSPGVDEPCVQAGLDKVADQLN
jgi:hypothetical protein